MFVDAFFGTAGNFDVLGMGYTASDGKPHGPVRSRKINRLLNGIDFHAKFVYEETLLSEGKLYVSCVSVPPEEQNFIYLSGVPLAILIDFFDFRPTEVVMLCGIILVVGFTDDFLPPALTILAEGPFLVLDA